MFIYPDQYGAIRELMTTYLHTGTASTPVRGRGKRTTKRNDRYLDSTDDETPVMVSVDDILMIKFN